MKPDPFKPPEERIAMLYVKSHPRDRYWHIPKEEGGSVCWCGYAVGATATRTNMAPRGDICPACMRARRAEGKPGAEGGEYQEQ